MEQARTFDIKGNFTRAGIETIVDERIEKHLTSLQGTEVLEKLASVVATEDIPIGRIHGAVVVPDESMTLTDIRWINNQRNHYIHAREGVPVDSWTLSDWATAMAGECGEACNVVKKIKRLRDGININAKQDGKEEKLFRDLGWELADTLLYIDLLATAAGVDLEKAVIEKFNKKSEEMDAPHRM